MLVKRRFYQNSSFWRRVLIALPVILYLWWFWDEFVLAGQLVLAFLTIFLRPGVVLPLNFETFRAVLVLLYTGLGFIGLFFGLLYLLAYYVLPVETHEEHVKVFDRLYLYFRKQHGPAIFIKNGAKIATPEEMNKPGPGVALVGMNSAVVLEKKVKFSPGKGNVSHNPLADEVSSKIFRVEGPGIVFLGKGETVRKVVDLRPQIRTFRDTFYSKREEIPDVRATTRDGIVVKTNVSTVFGVGQSPPTLMVTYHGGNSAEHLQILTLEEKTTKTPSMARKKIVKVKSFSDELDIEDKREIHQWILKIDSSPPGALSEPKKASPKRKLFDFFQFARKTGGSPFIFDRDRIFAAILSQPLEKGQSLDDDIEKRFIDWRDLPPRVAAEIFRNTIAQYYYDALYEPTESVKFPLDDIKAGFVKRVRNQGMLAIRVVRRKDRKPIEPGWSGNADELEITPARFLETPKVLRSRGIAVMAANFLDLTVDDSMRTDLMENWKASWKRDSDETLAGNELSASRIISGERAKIQRDMAYTFAKLMQSNEYSQEALAWRLYQAFEALAADPSTKQFLPQVTQNTMHNLKEWLETTGNPSLDSANSPGLPPGSSDSLEGQAGSGMPSDGGGFDAVDGSTQSQGNV